MAIENMGIASNLNRVARGVLQEEVGKYANCNNVNYGVVYNSLYRELGKKEGKNYIKLARAAGQRTINYIESEGALPSLLNEAEEQFGCKIFDVIKARQCQEKGDKEQEMPTVKIGISPVVKQTVKKNPELVISTHVKRENRIIVRLTDDEYKQLLDFVNNYTPRTTISEIVRSGVKNIIENAKQGSDIAHAISQNEDEKRVVEKLDKVVESQVESEKTEIKGETCENVDELIRNTTRLLEFVFQRWTGKGCDACEREDCSRKNAFDCFIKSLFYEDSQFVPRNKVENEIYFVCERNFSELERDIIKFYLDMKIKSSHFLKQVKSKDGENVLCSSSLSDEELESIKQWNAHFSDEQVEEEMKALVEKGYLS